MTGEWLQTERRFRSDLDAPRYVGVAHYVRDGVPVCGYRPTAITTLEPIEGGGNEPPPCMVCLKLRDAELIA